MKDMHGNEVKDGFFVEQAAGDEWVVSYYHCGRKIANDRAPVATRAEAESLRERLAARSLNARLRSALDSES